MEKKDLKIVYMGTPEFAVESLKRLVEGGYNVVGVITMPDKPMGRHESVLQPSPVKEYALSQGLKILQGISSELADNSSFAELYNIAESAWCILQSSANQTAFYNRRDRHCGNPAEMPNLIENEIELAKLMIKCQQKDSRIGFEASNHYMFGENNLLEKIISCQYILNSYVQ